MKIDVLMSSGEKDVFRQAANAVVVDTYLHILFDIPGDEIPDGMRTFDVVEEVERPAMKPLIMTTTYRLVAVYAPGMWMKIEYLSD